MKLLPRILERLERWPYGAVLLLCLGLTGLIALADYYTGPMLSSAIFYVAPIGIAAWYGSRRMAIVLSILAAMGWLWADMNTNERYSHTFYPVWNSFARLGLFLIIVYLMDNFREQLRLHRELAFTDPLTGLANNRAFVQSAAEEIRRSRRYAHTFTVAYVDVDDFKQVNDTLGHAAGDQLLVSAARAMRRVLRDTDHVARLGGDEFALLLPETGAAEARDTVHKLLGKLAARMSKGRFPVTFSVGLITFLKPPEDVVKMLKLADELMYEVKRSGKNGYRHETWPRQHRDSSHRTLPA